jgi:hypothetical protein
LLVARPASILAGVPPLPPTHREANREIFLKRRAEYATYEAAQLLRLGLGEMLSLIENGSCMPT